MKVFITGATGFIGKHLVKKLLDEGCNVHINIFGNELSPFDNRIRTYNLNELNANRDIEYFKQEDFDGVIHLASHYVTNHQPEDAVRLIDSNLRFSTYVLECTSRANIKWFINTGTFWQHYNNSKYSPVNLYAATKQAFETISQFYIETSSIKFITLKLCDTYGPNDERMKLFNLWIKSAKNEEIINMSPGEQVIDICYIDDITNAYLILTKHLNDNSRDITSGMSYVVSSKTRYTLKYLFEVFVQVTGIKPIINWGNKEYRNREVMIPWENGTIVPGWEQKYSIHEGLRNILNTNAESILR